MRADDMLEAELQALEHDLEILHPHAPSAPRCRAAAALESSSGKVGIWPVTKHQPSASTAWLNGATGVGAPGSHEEDRWAHAARTMERSSDQQQDICQPQLSSPASLLRSGHIFAFPVIHGEVAQRAEGNPSESGRRNRRISYLPLRPV